MKVVRLFKNQKVRRLENKMLQHQKQNKNKILCTVYKIKDENYINFFRGRKYVENKILKISLSIDQNLEQLQRQSKQFTK